MTSSNQDSKYLSAAIGHNSENAHTDETAGTRDDRQHSPYYRDYRRHAAPGDDTAARTMLVTRLAGLLHALVETTDESTLPDMVPTDADASHHGNGAVDEVLNAWFRDEAIKAALGGSHGQSRRALTAIRQRQARELSSHSSGRTLNNTGAAKRKSRCDGNQHA